MEQCLPLYLNQLIKFILCSVSFSTLKDSLSENESFGGFSSVSEGKVALTLYMLDEDSGDDIGLISVYLSASEAAYYFLLN